MGNYLYHHVVVGGTFDHLHVGHEFLLDKAFTIGEKVTIGLTSDNFVKNKPFNSALESYEVRLQFLKKYLVSKNYLSRTKIFPIHDIYGTSAQDPSLEAMVVTRQTYANAAKINGVRKKHGLPALKIIIINLKKSSNRKTVSSTRVRAGEIDRQGAVYRTIYKNSSRLNLPESLKVKLRIPPGEVYRGDESDLSQAANSVKRIIKKLQPVLVIAVGDIVAYSLNQVHLAPDLTIIDLKTRRHKLKNWVKLSQASVHINKAGTISRSSSDAIKNALSAIIANKSQKVLKINGEEDLLALIAILHAPLGAVVVYGQHGLGAVVVHIDEEVKKYVVELLGSFQPTSGRPYGIPQTKGRFWI